MPYSQGPSSLCSYSFIKQMTAMRLKIGLERILSLPGFSNEGQWVGCLLKENMHDVNSEREELKPLHEHYTSLRDLMVVPPFKQGFGVQGHNIEWCDVAKPKFKNNLLQLAARAYLQPVCKESRQEVHFIAQYWMAFTARNKTLIDSIVESLQRQMHGWVKFLRAQTFNLMHFFKPQHPPASLQMISI